MNLLALADFNLVVRHGGFGKAARATGRPKATLSRRVAELEAALRLRLLERGGRALTLTEEGRALSERTRTLLTELDEAVTAVASGGAAPRGSLRINAPQLFSQTIMGKLVADFVLKYPEVQVEVTPEDRTVNMIDEGYDLVIRANPAPDDSLVGRVFLRDSLIVVASPALERPADVVTMPAIVRSDGEKEWKVVAGGRRKIIAIRPVLRLSSQIMAHHAALAGAGAACLPLCLVRHDIAQGRLVHLADVDAPKTELWALYPSRRFLSARVSAFMDHLKHAFPDGMVEVI